MLAHEEEKMNKWELCFVRPKFRAGVEVVFLHPDSANNKIYRNLADFAKHRNIKADSDSINLLAAVISLILNDAWEPMNICVGIEDWNGSNLGSTGYSFRRQILKS